MAKLFHAFPFKRTEEDYLSRLVAVKEGPVRVIRQTANRVYMALGIHSPSVRIDILCYSRAVIADIIIDFPFRIGLLFSDVVSIPVIDVAQGSGSVFSDSEREGLLLDRKETEGKKRFNASDDLGLALATPHGTTYATVTVERDSPVLSRNYLLEEGPITEPDGKTSPAVAHLGFYQTRWEKLTSQTHHIWFTWYMGQTIPIEEGLLTLKRFPGPGAAVSEGE